MESAGGVLGDGDWEARARLSFPVPSRSWIANAPREGTRADEAGFTPFGDPAVAVPLLDRLKTVVDRQPGATVIADDRGELRFRELWRDVIGLTAAIQASGTGLSPVGIVVNPDRDYLVAVFACVAAGRLAVLLDAAYPMTRNNAILAATRIGLLITDAQNDARIPCVSVARSAHFEGADTRSWRPLGLDAPAFILATSGSSGAPKAIVQSQRNMLHLARTSHDMMRITPRDRALTMSSPSTLGGIAAIVGYPLAGASLATVDLKARGLAGFFATLVRDPITVLRAVPSFLRSLTRVPESRAAFAKLRMVQVSGEPLLRSDLAAISTMLPPNCPVRTAYGSTECTGLTGFAELSDVRDALRVPAGRTMPDTQVRIDDEGRTCGPNEVGELIVRSRYNALGEWVDGRMVAGRLVPDPQDPLFRIYRTGDLARYDDDGVFVILGRKDRMLNVNGNRVEPAEIEAVLRAQPGVADAEVLAVDRLGAPALVAFLASAAPARAALETELRLAVRTALPPFMMPSRFFVLDVLPRLPSGKIDAQALRALAGAQ